MRTKKPILLVEDDQVDVMTMKRALRDVQVPNRLEVTGDGEEALAFLNNPENEKPGIILLDLNLPKMNGIEFLRVVKDDDILRRIPVVVLTASGEEKDKEESFSLGIAGYMLKPVAYQQLVEVVNTINLYWTLSELPGEE